MRNNASSISCMPCAASRWLKAGFILFFVANIMAVALLALRSPLVSYHQDTAVIFGRFLVLHVTFSLWGWNLCCLIGFAYQWINKTEGLEAKSPLALFMAGILLMVISALIGDGQPVLSNYLPVIDHATFFTGLALSGSVVTYQLLWLFRHYAKEIRNNPTDLTTVALFASLSSALFALLTIAFNFLSMGGGATEILPYEQIFWGGGHIMMCSLLYVLVALCAYFVSQLKGEPIKSGRACLWVLLTLFLLIVCSAGITLGAFGNELARPFFTHLMAFHTASLAPLFIVVLMRRNLHSSSIGSGHQQYKSILVAIGLLIFGAFIGSFITSESLLVPAHYHAVTGAINLLFLLLVIQVFLPENADEYSNLRWQKMPIVYGGGVFLLSLGLTIAGHVGIGRKTVGVDETGATLMGYGGLAMAIVGGLIAILSVFLLVGKLFPYKGIERSKVSDSAVELGVENNVFKNKGRYESSRL